MHPRKKILYIGNKLSVHGKPPAGIDTLSIMLEDEGYTVVTASSKKNKISRLLDMVLTAIVNRKRVSLVLIDTYSTQNFYYAVIIAFLCRLFKLPYIPILHGGNLPARLHSSKSLSKKLFGKALTNIAPSKYMETQFRAKGFQNITYIPNTLDIAAYSFKSRPVNTPKLLWVRSFSEIYNPLLAIKIVEGLKKKGVAVSLCMVGPDKDGSLQKCKKLAAELDLDVRFTGMLQKKEWVSLAQDYNIFINTTNFDNMPVSVMEAMALGFPVISTNVGGLPYLIDDKLNGILVEPNNPEVFMNEILFICDNPLKAKEMSENARAKMEEFDWQTIKHQWINLLGS